MKNGGNSIWILVINYQIVTFENVKIFSWTLVVDYSNCTVIGDKGYISAQVQLDLFETANIRLEVPYRCNQKEWKPAFPAFAKVRKRIETLFSQLCDQFMVMRNYAKDTDGLFTRIIGKISALTVLQYINYKNDRPIGRVKYALI